MRKIHLTLLVLCLAVSSAFCQNSLSVTLSEEHPTHEVAIPSFNASELGRISFVKGTTDANDNALVAITIENNSNEYRFLLFNKYYGQNELRRHKPRIVFGKFFPGKSIEKVEGAGLTEIKVFPDDRNGFSTIDGNIFEFPNMVIKEGESKELTLPLYLAKRKKTLFCSRLELVGKIDLGFSVTVQKSDKDYDRIKAECDSIDLFLDDLEANNTFCTHPSHNPPYKKQIEPYTNRIKDLQDEINQKLNDRRHPIADARREQYNNLLDLLERDQEYLSNGYKHDCGKHKKHSCTYCKLTLEQIYRKLDNYYIELKNADAQEFDAKKKAIMKEVNAMHKCCTDPTCAKHAAQWKKGGQIKQKIEERYDQLKKL